MVLMNIVPCRLTRRSRESDSRPASPTAEPDAVVAPGPSQVLTGIMGRLPEATSRDAIDQAATEFMFVNSKAARKRLVKVCSSHK
jgi:regulator of nonsense transcripts 2